VNAALFEFGVQPWTCRLTPQFSGGALTYAARRTCIMKWRTCAAPRYRLHRPLQLLVSRLAQHSIGTFFKAAARHGNHDTQRRCAAL